MEDSNLSMKLRALASGRNRSATARIREKFDEIEAALKASVPRIEVHKALVEDGIDITFESFELAIYRIRKERKQSNIIQSKQIDPTSQNQEKTALDTHENKGIRETVLEKPKGITDAEWKDRQQKHMKEQRHQRNLLKGI